jgi:hypothetical protein
VITARTCHPQLKQPSKQRLFEQRLFHYTFAIDFYFDSLIFKPFLEKSKPATTPLLISCAPSPLLTRRARRSARVVCKSRSRLKVQNQSVRRKKKLEMKLF